MNVANLGNDLAADRYCRELGDEQQLDELVGDLTDELLMNLEFLADALRLPELREARRFIEMRAELLANRAALGLEDPYGLRRAK